MGKPLNGLNNASGTSADETKVKNKSIVWKKEPYNTWECQGACSAHSHQYKVRGRLGGDGKRAHIYRLNAKCHPQKKK